MTAKHTPGPWTTAGDGYGIEQSSEGEHDEREPQYIGHAERRVDARFMAASPEMFAALQQGVAAGWRYEGAHKTCVHCGNSVPPSTQATEIEHEPKCFVAMARAAMAKAGG